jgi:hypothetical protein
VGGGYFFWSGNKGIVIDPGIDFIKNFLAAGFHIDMIDKVIVTHAHPDHIADVPSIITLLHEQNEYIKKSSRINKSTVYEDIYEIKVPELKKRIDIYLNPSAYKYLDGILAIDNTKANYDLHMIDANMIDRNILDDIELCTLPTIHEDCLSKDLGVGIILRSQKQNFQIIYTSDTSINEDLIDRYKVKLSKNKFNTVMIGNIGGVHQNELNALIHFEENRGQVGILTKEFRYPNHLGIIGFVTLINRLKTIININTVIIGEIGLEMQNVKVTLSEKIGEEVNIPTIISDLGLSIDVESNSIYALDIDGTHKLLPTTNVSSLLTQNGDCIYVSKELNEEDINKAQYQDNQKAWFKNIPILW